MTATRKESAGLGRKAGRWTVGLLVVALCAVLLWFGLGWQRDAADVVDATAPAAGGDIMPPIDDGAEPSPPPALPDQTSTDVIPPEEP